MNETEIKIPPVTFVEPDTREMVKRTLEGYLADNLVRIVVDATHPGVKVPMKHKGNPALHLNLSFRFEGHKMAFDQDAFRVNMIFSGADFRVEIPYDAFLAASPIPREEKPPKALPKKAERPSFLKVVK